MGVLERGALLLARDVRVPQVVVVVRGLDVSGYRLQPETLRRRLEALPPRPPDHEKQWSDDRGKGRSERRGGCQKTDNARHRPASSRTERACLSAMMGENRYMLLLLGFKFIRGRHLDVMLKAGIHPPDDVPKENVGTTTGRLLARPGRSLSRTGASAYEGGGGRAMSAIATRRG